MSVFEIQPVVGQQSHHGAAFPLLLTPAQAGDSVADLVRAAAGAHRLTVTSRSARFQRLVCGR
jgi:hypothetical protein